MVILQKIASLIRRLPSAVWRRLLCKPVTLILKLFYGVKIGRNPLFVGWPILDTHGQIEFGNDCVLVSSQLGNPIGLFRPCIIGTLDNSDGTRGRVKIGDRFAASGVCIWAQEQVIIGDDVLVGANVTIVDTDFHSSDPVRWHDGHRAAKAKGIFIEDNVWIGMNAVILKGVTIGKRAIIGANCVVSRNVPAGCTLVSSSNRIV